jgi:putative ABC transport system permease protein
MRARGAAATIRDAGRDALTAARGQRVASVVSALVVAGVTTAILATTGQTVAAERRVLSQINSPAGRLVVLTDDEGRAHVDAGSIAAIAELDGVEWVVGLGQALDVTNAAVPAGTAVPARRIYGTWPAALDTAVYRQPAAGDALVGPQAGQRLGLLEPLGGITSTRLGAPVVGAFTAGEPLTDLNSSVLVHVDAAPGHEIRTVMLSVENVRDIDDLTRAATALLIAEDPSRLSATTNANLAELQQVIGSQLAQTSRRLVWVALAAGMVLITVTQFGAVSQRARDYGRRRALGATRTGILVHVLLQVGLCAAAGAFTGTAIGLAIDWRFAGALPGAEFTAAVATLSVIAPLLAALPPALRAAYRDPVRILRVP